MKKKEIILPKATKLEMTTKDFNRFMRIPGYKFKNDIYQQEERPQSERKAKKWEEEGEWLDRVTETGLLGFRVSSWGMEEGFYFLTKFGEWVKANYTV